MMVRNARLSQFACLKTELFIKENGSQSPESTRRMGVEFKYGLMGPAMMAFGVTEWPMATEDSCTQRATSMKGNGPKTKPMDMVFIPISTAVATRASGLPINNMDLELNSGLTVPSTTVNTSKE